MPVGNLPSILPSRSANDAPGEATAPALLRAADEIAEEAGGDRELGEREAGIGDLVDRHTHALDLVPARGCPRLHRPRAHGTVAGHRRGKPLLHLPDGIKGTVERKPVEIVRDD